MPVLTIIGILILGNIAIGTAEVIWDEIEDTFTQPTQTMEKIDEE